MICPLAPGVCQLVPNRLEDTWIVKIDQGVCTLDATLVFDVQRPDVKDDLRALGKKGLKTLHLDGLAMTLSHGAEPLDGVGSVL